LTAFATSWRRAEPALLALALLVGACGAPKQAEEPLPPPPAPAEEESPAASAPAAVAGAGLRPLPTPGQVVSSMARGRTDPFGEVLPRPRPPAPAGAPSAPGGAAGPGGPAPSGPDPFALPPDFRLAGVMRSGGRSAAVVQAGSRSGSLRPGDRGGRSTDLLPPGWLVASIDVNQGRLTLQRGARRVSLDL
jgi:hypothetical protein